MVSPALFIVGLILGAEPAQPTTPPVPQHYPIEQFKIEQITQAGQCDRAVAIAFNDQGDIYVAEYHRWPADRERGIFANVNHPYLLDDDLACQTVDDRRALIDKWQYRFPGGMQYFTEFAEKVRLLRDRDGDGKIDESHLFADGFNDPLDGGAAGIAERDGKVYFACIPHLWMLEDKNGDGEADERKPLARGFGVRFGYNGHDLHGLTWGPDGRLYMSIGDRGYHIQTADGRVLHSPDSGGVLRCEPDGSNLEVFHHGLRNPQDLAFDDFGNLFTGDNNADKGDRARLVYVVEAGETGFSMNYQTIGQESPWTRESLWKTKHEGQPAYIVPPIAHMGGGPAGLSYYPGVGFSSEYAGRFFLCDFGASVGGGTIAFSLANDGATYRVDREENFWTRAFAHVEFGYDGKMYVADFGGISTVVDPKVVDLPEVKQLREIFRTGFKGRTMAELLKLLEHADQRVRQRSHLELAERGPQVAGELANVAASSSVRFARLHALWALGIVARRHPTSDVLAPIVKLLDDPDPEVRAQTIRALDDGRYQPAAAALVKCLQDSNLRTRYFACLAVGRLRINEGFDPLVQVLEANANQDAFLRHGATMGLAWLGDRERLLKLADHSSAAVRLGAVVALRRLAEPEIAQFLIDKDLLVVNETAIAIHDAPIPAALPKLAESLGKLAHNHPFYVRRALNANYRLGDDAGLNRVIEFANQSQNAGDLRQEAFDMLSSWVKPAPRDRVLGFWGPLADRDAAAVAATLNKRWPELERNDLPDRVLNLANVYSIAIAPATLLQSINNAQLKQEARAAALRLLASTAPTQAAPIALSWLNDQQMAPLLRLTAQDAVVTTATPDVATSCLDQILKTAPTVERQSALHSLAKLKYAEADQRLVDRMQELVTDKLDPSLELDLLEACRERAIDALSELLRRYDAALAEASPTLKLKAAGNGGDPKVGREVFESATANCMRCHKLNGRGSTVGPDLSKIAAQRDGQYLLQALIEPSAKIAEGYVQTTLELSDGRVINGRILAETPEQVSLVDADGKQLVIPIAEIEVRQSATVSPMPPMHPPLSPRQIRDLVAFLSSLK